MTAKAKSIILLTVSYTHLEVYKRQAHEQKLAMAARKAREENNLVIEKQEVQRASKRRRRMTVWAAGLSAAVVALAAVIILWVVPAVRYKSAMGLIGSRCV